MPPETEPEVEHCQVTYRVLCDSAATVRRLPDHQQQFLD